MRGERKVRGPYYESARNAWRVECHDGPVCHVARFEIEAEARQYAEDARAHCPDIEGSTQGWIDRWELARRQAGYGYRSSYGQASKVRCLVGALTIGQMTAARIQQLIAARVKSKSPSTVASELQAVRSWLRWLTAEGVPMGKRLAEIDELKVPGRRNAGKRQLTADEARWLLGACLSDADTEAGTAVAACLLLGVRARELLDRQVRDVDEGGTVLVIWRGKTATARRRLEIPAVLRPGFAALREGKMGSDYLFAQRRLGKGRVHRRPGAPRSTTWLQQHTARLCRAAGVPKVCPHGLRGTHASLAEACGVTAHQVAAQLGHADTEVTGRHYTAGGVRPQAAAREVERRLAGHSDSHSDSHNEPVVTEPELPLPSTSGRLLN